MATSGKNCDVCGKKAESLKICKSCERHYCSKCQSASTTQNFCKECVAMKDVVSQEES